MPYDASYGTVRRTIVWNRTMDRTARCTVAYNDSYDAVRRVIRYCTTRRTASYESSYATVRPVVRFRTMVRRTVPYDASYESSYGVVRRLVRCRTAARTGIILSSGSISRILSDIQISARKRISASIRMLLLLGGRIWIRTDIPDIRFLRIRLRALVRAHN